VIRFDKHVTVDQYVFQDELRRISVRHGTSLLCMMNGVECNEMT
jgi:hypothetical protein